MKNRITSHFRDYDASDFTSPPSPEPLPLDDETRRAAILRLHDDLGRLGLDVWFQGGGLNIVNKQGETWVAFRVELLGEHVMNDD